MTRDYKDPLYQEWRKRVLKRDGRKCQMPGCKRGGKKMQVHHIKKWSAASYLRYEISNGITLCWNCHKEVTGAEHQYESLFMQLVRNNEK